MLAVRAPAGPQSAAASSRAQGKKGRETVAVHPICHRTIHANFTNAELARMGEDRAALLEDEAVAKFVRWVKHKPPDFHAPTRKGR